MAIADTTVDNLLADIKRGLDEDPDTTDTHWGADDTVLLRRLNEVYRAVVKLTRCLTKERTQTNVAYQNEYDLESDFLEESEVFFDGRALEPVSKSELNFRNPKWRQATGVVSNYFIENGKIYFYRIDSEAAETDTLNGAITAAATEITVDSTSDIAERGTIKIDDEKISYTNKTATQFKGCTRGAEGTTAATHADGATVTDYNIKIVYAYKPDDLVSGAGTLFGGIERLQVYCPVLSKGVIAVCKEEDEDTEAVITRKVISSEIGLGQMIRELRGWENVPRVEEY